MMKLVTRRLHGVIFVLLAMSTVAGANSRRNIGPLAKVDELSIEVMRGDSLGLGADRGRPIFGRDFDRLEYLEAEMAASAAGNFEAGGIRVVDKSDNVVVLKLFGGTFQNSTSDSSVFFMLQVDVCLAGERACLPERTVLGVADDRDVETSVLEAVLEATTELVQARSAYRRSPPSMQH